LPAGTGETEEHALATGGAARGPSPGNPSPFFFAEIKQSQETIMSTEVPRRSLSASPFKFAARRPDELRRIAEEGSSELAFVSSDRTVVFTVEEMAALQEWCPAIINLRRMIYSACRGWLQRLPERKRKPALVDWLLEKGESMSPPKPKLRRAGRASHAGEPPISPDSWIGRHKLAEQQQRAEIEREAKRRRTLSPGHLLAEQRARRERVLAEYDERQRLKAEQQEAQRQRSAEKLAVWKRQKRTFRRARLVEHVALSFRGNEGRVGVESGRELRRTADREVEVPQN
jgi:hypothetical protein